MTKIATQDRDFDKNVFNYTFVFFLRCHNGDYVYKKGGEVIVRGVLSSLLCHLRLVRVQRHSRPAVCCRMGPVHSN